MASALTLCTTETIEIEIVGGAPDRVTAHRLGDFAVHHFPDIGGWRVTHLPTGCSIARGFENIDSAAEAMAEIARLRNDWSVLTAEDVTPKLRDQVEEISQRFGGFCGTERRADGWSPRFDWNGYGAAHQ